MIIAQYGHSNSQSITENGDITSPVLSQPGKTSSSEFDVLLSQLKNINSSASKLAENEILSSESHKDVSLEQNYADAPNAQSDEVRRVDESFSSTTTNEVKHGEGLKDTKKLGSADLKYISELNKKMNQLLEKIKNAHQLSDGSLQGLTGELKSLMFQFQQFVNHTQGGSSFSSETRDIFKLNPMLDKLFQGMFRKLESAKDALKQLGVKFQQTAASLKGISSGVEANLIELKKVDQELDKTIALFKELKQVNQDGKNILEGEHLRDKFSQKSFSELTFHLDPKQIHRKDWNNTKHISSHITSEGTTFNTSTTSNHHLSNNFFSQEEKNSHSDFMNQNGVSAGLGKTSFLTETGGLKDFSQMSVQDKVALGKEILTQIQTEMKGYIGKKQSQFSIALKPEELGDVKVIMEMKDGVIKTQIVVENEVIKDLLKHRFDEMKLMFQENGVNISELNVKTQAEHQFYEQNQGEKVQSIFNSYQQSTEQIRLNRQLENLQKTHWAYEKTVDNLSTDKEFIITV